MIIAIYDHEPFVQLITAEKLCMDIKCSYKHLVDISLPIRDDWSRLGENLDPTLASDLATYAENADLPNGHSGSFPDTDTRSESGDASAGTIAEPQSDRSIERTNRGHEPQKFPGKPPPDLRPTKSNVDAMHDSGKSFEGRSALELELEARNSENTRLRELNEETIKGFYEYKFQDNIKILTRMSEFQLRRLDDETIMARLEALQNQAAEIRGKLDASQVSQKAKATEVEKLKQQLKAGDTNGQARIAYGQVSTYVMLFVSDRLHAFRACGATHSPFPDSHRCRTRS